MLAGVVAAQDHVVDLADVHEFCAAGIADGALHVFFHLAQRIDQLALDRLQDALAFDMLVLAPVEVRGAAVVLLEVLAIYLDRLARAFFQTRQHDAIPHHGCPHADGFAR